MPEVAHPGDAAFNLRREQEDRGAFQTLVGYRLEAWEEGRAVVAVRLRPEHMNRTGRPHGGLLATLLDAALGFAGCYTPVPGAIVTTLTLSLTVNFIALAGDDRLIVEARRTGGGRKVFFAEAEVRDGAGRLVATGVGTFRLTGGRPADEGPAAGGSNSAAAGMP